MRSRDAYWMLRALRRSILAVSLLLIALFGYLAWNHLVGRAEALAQKNASVIEEYMLRLIQTQDVVLAAADEALRGYRPLGALDREAHDFLRELSDRIDGNIAIAFVRSDGRVLASSFVHPAEGSVGDRAYLRETPEGGVYIERLTVQPVGIDALVVARRPRAFAGAEGVWVSAARIEVVTEFLDRIAGPQGNVASILREDGLLLVRNVPLEAPFRIDGNQAVMRVVREEGGGVYRATALSDGRQRIYATARVGNLPIYVNFGISLRALVLEWAMITAVAGLVIGTIGGAAYMLARYAERSLRAEAAQAALAFDRRLLAEAEKTAALRETMLRELNHRVKNSLQMIQSLIRLQRGRPAGPDFDEIGARVIAIATIHDLLYQSTGDLEVDFGELLRRIAASPAIVPPESRVAVDVWADPVTIDASAATSLALCAVELVTNAVKHAYPGGEGRIEVRLERIEDAHARLVVADHGPGLSGGGRRSGLRVVEELVRQLRGRLETASDGGARFTIVFPLAAESDGIAAGLAAS